MGSGVAVVGDELGVDESEIKGLEEPESRGVSLDNGFEPIEKGEEEVVDKLVDGGDGQSGAEGVVVGGDDVSGENGDDGDGLKSDIVVPPEEGGGGSEFVEKDEVKMEGDVVEGENGSRVEEEVGHHGDREIDDSELDGKIGSHVEEVEEIGANGDREINGSVSDEDVNYKFNYIYE